MESDVMQKVWDKFGLDHDRMHQLELHIRDWCYKSHKVCPMCRGSMRIRSHNFYNDAFLNIPRVDENQPVQTKKSNKREESRGLFIEIPKIDQRYFCMRCAYCEKAFKNEGNRKGIYI